MTLFLTSFYLTNVAAKQSGRDAIFKISKL